MQDKKITRRLAPGQHTQFGLFDNHPPPERSILNSARFSRDRLRNAFANGWVVEVRKSVQENGLTSKAVEITFGRRGAPCDRRISQGIIARYSVAVIVATASRGLCRGV